MFIEIDGTKHQVPAEVAELLELVSRERDELRYRNWMSEARQLAAQCWCDPETKGKEMDAVLAEAVAKRIAFWMDTAAQNERNTDYYRGLVVQCGQTIGREAYIQDDGNEADEVLCAKVPELVEKLCAKRVRCNVCGVRFTVHRFRDASGIRCPKCSSLKA